MTSCLKFEIRDIKTFLHLCKCLISLIMSLSTDSGKQYHLQCTGEALDTVNAHAADADITLFGSCFCPFVQRVWVAFEYLGIPYRVRVGLDVVRIHFEQVYLATFCASRNSIVELTLSRFLTFALRG